jgi:hypothetical protein
MPDWATRTSQVLCCQVECFKLLAVVLLHLSILLHEFLQVLSSLKVLSAAVNMHKLVHSKITPAHSNHNVLPLNLHKHSSSVVPINALRFPLEGHSAPDREGLFVDNVFQFLVDRVFFHRLVGAHLLLDLLARDFEV